MAGLVRLSGIGCRVHLDLIKRTRQVDVSALTDVKTEANSVAMPHKSG